MQREGTGGRDGGLGGGQHQKPPRMGITGRKWSRCTAAAGVHWKRLSTGHQTLSVCTRGGRQGNRPRHIFCVIYSFIFIFCAFLQRLPGLKTLLLPANTYETQPVTYCLSPQLIYRWVLMIICDFLSLWPRSVWDLKCPSPAEEVHITPRLLTLPYQICFSVLDTLSHTHYTSIT